MTHAETKTNKPGADPAQVARAEALFEQTQPRGVRAADHPFHRWHDQTQRYFLAAANG